MHALSVGNCFVSIMKRGLLLKENKQEVTEVVFFVKMAENQAVPVSSSVKIILVHV